tara:strand:- start:2690 stop:3730 length:1041 start_codon:yes stop_codon:yes gene_type:complete
MAIIDKPTDYFNTVLYTGTGSSNTVDVGFEPNLTWIKNKGTESHCLFDTVRTNGYYLKSDANSAEINGSSGGSGLWSAFTSNGFTVLNGNRTNDNGDSYVSWNWKAGTSFTNDASATGIGSIDSTGSVNTDAGFSIISYTGTASAATVAHGLGAVPKMIIVKTRGGSGDWSVYHSSLGNTKNLKLNTTAAQQTSASYWNNTTPTSSVFTINDEGNVNGSSVAMIAYCFANTSMSKFGSYTGNGNADGTFVYTGFKPAFVMVKQTTARYWVMFDNKRDGFNPTNRPLFPNASDQESDSVNYYHDILSNGFKWRTNVTIMNESGGSYIYMCFAESPFVSSSGVPATAR